MNFTDWKRKIWPTLTSEEQEKIKATVRSLRAAGWPLPEAWTQAACTAL